MQILHFSRRNTRNFSGDVPVLSKYPHCIRSPQHATAARVHADKESAKIATAIKSNDMVSIVLPERGMETYTAKEAKNRLGEVLRAALRNPVVITVHGKPSVQLTSVQSAESVSPPNAQDKLDNLKHRLSCAVLANFPLEAIKRHSLANIERWRSNGVTGPAYEAWEAIILDLDDMRMIKAMVGLDQLSNQLRQSIPYVGMLPTSMVEELNAEIVDA